MKIITHNGKFHADEIFALATISLCFGQDDIQVLRTRDSEFFSSADMVVDVGGVYDGEKFFDHHQKGGAGKRDSDIPYASFGLVWKKFGKKICDSSEVSLLVDENFVQFIDLVDCGCGEVKPFFENINPVYITDVITFLNLERTSVDDEDLRVFNSVLDFAVLILKNVIAFYKKQFIDRELVVQKYEEANDKRVIVFDDNYEWEAVLSNFKDVLYVIEPDNNSQDISWRLGCVRVSNNSFINRKDLPSNWGGLRGLDLERETGVEGSVFCHNALFMAINKTKEGAIKMAEKALLG
jgi:uncharacterized UPF0160 family protein